jgi:uncharacterized Fe-S cluster-containing MiaB family protein
VNDRRVLELRGPKAAVEQAQAYASTWEEEPDTSGLLVPTAVVFLTNRECPFRCVMCDLWVNTLDTPVNRGAIPAQIRRALAGLPPASQIKLYNAGSFFDPQAIPPEDDETIAASVDGFDRVIVESHPAFLERAAGERCIRFRDLLAGEAGPLRGHRPTSATGRRGLATRTIFRPGLAQHERRAQQPRLEVAIGLETAHEATLARLNKRMTVESFRRAAGFLADHDIALRVFILLNPPFLRGAEAIEWACRSIDVAAECGAGVCSVIPTRGGNGAMEALGDEVERPGLRALEAVIEYGLSRGDLRIFADLWDTERFFDCACSLARAERLRAMNRGQCVTERVTCADCR